MMRYIAWTGLKFKGHWADRETALRYGANNPDVTIVPVDVDNPVDPEEIEAMRQKIAEEAKAAKPGGAVHHLKAKGIASASKGKARSVN